MSLTARHRRTTAPWLVAAIVISIGLSACSSSGSTAAEETPKPTCESTPAEMPDTPAEYTGVGASGEVAVAGGALAPFSAAAEDPAVGCAAPVIAGQNFEGDPTVIGGVSEKPTLVVAVAHWCPHCNVEVPKIVEWVEDTDIEDDVDLVVVSTKFSNGADNYPPRTWLRNKMGWTGAVLADNMQSEAGEALGVTSFPMMIMIDSDGTVVKRLAGEQDISELQTMVDGVVSGSGS